MGGWIYSVCKAVQCIQEACQIKFVEFVIQPSHQSFHPLPPVLLMQVASKAGLTVPQPIGPQTAHVTAAVGDADVAQKAQQAERVAHAAAAPAGVSA